jgi:hypothetical protein
MRPGCSDQRGIVLLIALTVVALLGAAGLGALLSAQNDLRTSANLVSTARAFYIGEAGLSHAWQEVADRNGRNDFGRLIGAGPVLLFSNVGFAGGSYTVRAEPILSPPALRVISIGCLPAADPCPAGHAKAVLEAHLRIEDGEVKLAFWRERTD